MPLFCVINIQNKKEEYSALVELAQNTRSDLMRQLYPLGLYVILQNIRSG